MFHIFLQNPRTDPNLRQWVKQPTPRFVFLLSTHAVCKHLHGAAANSSRGGDLIARVAPTADRRRAVRGFAMRKYREKDPH